MLLARGKKKSTLYMTAGSRYAIFVAESSNESNLWHCRLRNVSEKVIKVLQSKGKLHGLKSEEIDFYEDCVFEK